MEDANGKTLPQEDLRQNAGVTAALWLLCAFFLRALLASWLVSILGLSQACSCPAPQSPASPSLPRNNRESDMGNVLEKERVLRS